MAQLAPGSLRGASGRCHAKTAQRAESVAVTSHCSVPYVASASASIVQRCKFHVCRRSLPGTRKQHLWWVFLDQASILRLLIRCTVTHAPVVLTPK
jgi:hypothetical protein